MIIILYSSSKGFEFQKWVRMLSFIYILLQDYKIFKYILVGHLATANPVSRVLKTHHGV